MGEVSPGGGDGQSGLISKLNLFLNWARQWSMWQYPFVTACCGMEFMSLFGPRYDLARFGAEALTGTPRPSDLLWVVGTISQRQAPILKQIYEQMAEPKWVIAVGTCACTGGFYDNYATLAGADKVIPVDIYVPGCPPRPEAIVDGFLLLQEKVVNNNRVPATIPPRRLPPLAKISDRNPA
jgi:NADH-quinone oxidoreductase subunit B